MERTFPIITKELQQEFEREASGHISDNTPDICGYYGRACYQMDKEEGANRALCRGCYLKDFCEGKGSAAQMWRLFNAHGMRKYDCWRVKHDGCSHF